jgi:hypothetical protein
MSRRGPEGPSSPSGSEAKQLRMSLIMRLFATALVAALAPSSPAQELVLENANLIDGTGRSGFGRGTCRRRSGTS